MPERLKTTERVIPLKRILIANRGEIAVRAAETLQRRGIQAVVPYSATDAESMITRIADATPGWKLAPLGGTSQEQSYANAAKMLQTAQLHRCDGIFLGYGFLAENEDFVRMCEQSNPPIRILAPSSRAMEVTGNKIKAREIAKKVRLGRIHGSIPVLEGTGSLLSADMALEAAHQSGFPVMLKDPDLGGGSGNIVVRTEEELRKAYRNLRMRQGNKELYLERFIERATHVEIQIAADHYGNVISLGERDCTMQRRNQKIIEESPSPHVPKEVIEHMKEAAVKFAKEVNYSGIGTWEFIVDMDRKDRHGNPRWYFMEVNPRIQVEHGVTELQTGVDIVNLMIDIAEERRLPFTQEQIQARGHTIEARVYAEDPQRNFEQVSGKLDVFDLQMTKGIRIDTGYQQGDTVSSWFDGILGKIVSHGYSREDARAKLVEYLRSMGISLPNNAHLLIELLDSEAFRKAQGSTTFVEKWWQQRLRDMVHINDFMKDGVPTQFPPSRTFDPSRLPNDVTIPTRRSDVPLNRAQREEAKKVRGEDSQAEYEFYERDGIRLVLYSHTYDGKAKAGPFGVGEGNLFSDAVKLAHDAQTFLVTIVPTTGINQDDNNAGLIQMRAGISDLITMPPLLHVNIFAGSAYGGPPASFLGVADLQIAIDSEDTKIGITGPYMVAKTCGIEPKGLKAEDIYQDLPEGMHSPSRAFKNRWVDMLEPSQGSAADKIFHIAHILGYPSMITDPNVIFRPQEPVSRQLINPVERFDREGGQRGRFGRLMSRFHHDRSRKPAPKEILPTKYMKLDPNERLRVIRHPDRPTAVDLIMHTSVFDDAVLLSSDLHVEGADQYPATIFAIAKIADMPVAVVGLQTQRVRDETTGEIKKVYGPQTPADWEYLLRMLSLAKKLQLPLILLGDTEGADCKQESEDRGQLSKLASVISATEAYPFPVLSVNIGMKGSGGGETLIGPLDAAADFENAMSFVAADSVQYWIETGRWIDSSSPPEKQEELRRFILQLRDATAEVRRDELFQIDEIILEGPGGAHLHPEFVSANLRRWAISQLSMLMKLDHEALEKRRRERTQRARQVGTVPNL
ncbi:MAG: ATP-grasp domain-containing protein [Candidatus Levybacteria bacterium]|nr:ATP-grasp domain-containing protein [Candidatus Levybacteria bacterium]